MLKDKLTFQVCRLYRTRYACNKKIADRSKMYEILTRLSVTQGERAPLQWAHAVT